MILVDLGLTKSLDQTEKESIHVLHVDDEAAILTLTKEFLKEDV